MRLFLRQGAPARQAYEGDLVADYEGDLVAVMDVSALGEPVELAAEPGDCILMDKRTVHSSGPNATQRERVGLVLAFAICGPEDLNESAVAFGPDGCREVGCGA